MKLIHSAHLNTKPVIKDVKTQLIEILQQINMEKYLLPQHAFSRESDLNDGEKFYKHFYVGAFEVANLVDLRGALSIWGDLCKSDRMSVIAEFLRVAAICGGALSSRHRSLIFCHIFIDNFLVVLVRG